jgi:hypothetical protein
MPTLTPWPTYNQLDDWTVDADGIDENKENNCGPESIAMCLKYLTGVELPADFIKDAIYGQAHLGYTLIPDLVKFLQRRCQIPATTHSGDGATLLQPAVRAAIDAGNPIIVLYFMALDQPNSGHFCPVIGYDEGGCTRANPWGGVLEYQKWAEFEKWQKFGNAIVLKRVRAKDLGDRDPLTPADPLIETLETLRAEAHDYVDRALERKAGRR